MRAALEIFKKRVPEIGQSIIESNMRLGLDLMRTERYARQGSGWIEDRAYMNPRRKVDCLHDEVPAQSRGAEVDALRFAAGTVP